jgi:acetyltransferase-like isoleucine patch superfamily enzyme
VRLGKIARRFFMPRIVSTLVYYIRFRCFISPRAEVDLSRSLTIGKRTKVSSFCKIKVNGRARIGSDVSIATGCFVGAAQGGIEIGDFCLIGPNCTIVSGTYNTSRLDVPFAKQGRSSKGTRIGHNVMIGANSVVLDGAVIGDGVIISPGSVVSGRIDTKTVVQGNPAAEIFRRRA